MEERDEILQELRELGSPLAGFGHIMPYALPDGYLAQLAIDLAGHVAGGEDAETLPDFSREMPLEVPEGYFDSLPEILAAGAIAPGLKKGIANPFEVAPGYLEKLPASLLTFAKNNSGLPQKGRTISFVQLFRKRGIQWAAAAVLLLSVSLGMYRYEQYHNPNAIASRHLQQLDPEDLGGYVEQHVDEFDAESLEAAVASSKSDLKTSLSTVDEQEIQNYLFQTGDTNTATLN